MAPLFPSFTDPAGVSVLPVPTFLLLKLCVKDEVSPLARLPEVMVGAAVEFVVPS